MTSYKVVYFDGRGFAEATRMMLAHAGQEFEDVRYSVEDWAKIKADAPVPLQQLPYLEVDGTTIPQSRVMHGFVAREFGLNGASNKETTTIDIVIATAEEFRAPFLRIFYEKDEAKKKEQLAACYANTAPKYLTALESMLKNNNGGDGFFVGSKISRADIFFFVSMEHFDNDEVLEKYPKIVALLERVAKDPNIAAYLAKRPHTLW